MALDGIFLYKLAEELNAAKDCHVDKIYQPYRDTVAFLLRKKGFAKWLYMCASPSGARVNFCDSKPDCPDTPPMFCMLLRKHFSSARLVSAECKGLERVISFVFESHNELGDTVNLKIICELIGVSANIILTDNSGRIIDAVKRSDIETSQRLICSGAFYEYPPSQNKLDINAFDNTEIIARLNAIGTKSFSDALVSVLSGVSPLIARETEYRFIGTETPVCEIADTNKITAALDFLRNELLYPDKAVMLYDKSGTPFDFTYTDITQYGNSCRTEYFGSLSELLDVFYSERENIARIKRLSSDLNKTVKNALNRVNRRKELRQKELSQSENREALRIKGELIKANLHLILQGMESITVQNFYDENLSDITIKLDPAMSPSKQAAKCFKDYKKACVAEQTLKDLIQQDEKETEYLESVLESLERCKTFKDIAEIREELSEQKYIKSASRGKKKPEKMQFDEHISEEGYRIIVGKNNLQNDYLTTKLAAKTDTWFHTKNIHGSHVIVFNGGAPLSDNTVLFAARLAAKNSKAKHSSNVPVDYTAVKYVKKPAGAKPGMVIYTTNKTVFVTAEDNI